MQVPVYNIFRVISVELQTYVSHTDGLGTFILYLSHCQQASQPAGLWVDRRRTETCSVEFKFSAINLTSISNLLDPLHRLTLRSRLPIGRGVIPSSTVCLLVSVIRTIAFTWLQGLELKLSESK